MKCGSRLGAAAIVLGCLSGGAAYPQGAEPGMPTFTFGSLEMHSGLEGGIQAVTESNAFWNLADTFSPSVPFDAGPTWG